MINRSMFSLGNRRSVIRDIFEYGAARKKQIGAQNVFDFSLGNPSVPAPDAVKQTLLQLVDQTPAAELHGYTTAAGDRHVREAIADYLNRTYQADAQADRIYMTCGAAAALTITLSALVCPGDEVVLLAPYFPEYAVFVRQAGGVPVAASCPAPAFVPDMAHLAAAVSPRTKAVIVNSPNNPSGVVFTAEHLQAMSDLLRHKQAEYGHPIYWIADEPYRELVYDGEPVPYPTRYYDNTVVCYSFSKSLSLPGERIGYILVGSRAAEGADLYAAVCGAGRSLGFVCAPALFQKMVPACLGQTADLSVYKANRDRLAGALTHMGFTLAQPGGAFYLFMQAPGGNAAAFCETAKQFELLLVPSDDFGVSGYVRIAYCVAPDVIERSLPAFRQLADAYRLHEKRG